MRKFALSAAALLAGTALSGGALAASGTVPPAPQAPTTWAYAAKTGVGASYEAYVDGAYKDGGPTGTVSKVWYSIADGVLTETMYGLIHQAQIKQLRFAVMTPTGLAVEGADTTSKTEFLHVDAAGRPLSPAYKITTTDKQGRFEIEKRIFTDPDRQSLFLRVTVRALKGGATPYLLLEPHMANTGGNDAGATNVDRLSANDGGVFLTLKPSSPFKRTSVGWMGSSDGLTDLKDGKMDHAYATTGEARGAIMLTGQLATVATGEQTFDFAIGFGPDAAASEKAADGSLKTGYAEVLARFNGEGKRVGWEDYLASLTELPRLREAATDGGKLVQASALALKVQEDRTYAGALIASLSNPWGDTVSAENPSTGYKAVWPRDFYQCAMALAALGDKQTPLASFHYLPRVQVGPKTPKYRGGAAGWFLQKSEVDGTPEWVGVQLDQTAMPIMLGWKLWKLGWLPEGDVKAAYRSMLKPAADFLVDGGQVDIDWNHETIVPPFTQQERWEEQPGHSPSTTAAIIAGLTVAADIADQAGDPVSAARYRKAADDYSAKLEGRLFTTAGALGDGRYYLRINRTEDASRPSTIEVRNGQGEPTADKVMDAGFLELVRYGVRRADDPHVLATLPELDDQGREDVSRVRYDFRLEGQTYPGWRRYGTDGYGEDVANGGNYGAGGQMHAGQRGRVWPIFTGERGHYELAAAGLNGAPDAAAIARIRATYVAGMEAFANDGLMLSEQVWDGVGHPTSHAEALGEGTNSATPLAWSHAEYVKLLRSVSDGVVWDSYAPVKARYGAK
ncbi:glucan 1,4-alpha-glucosidase [Caulobacter sp. 17J80-11]|uniref:glucan 1,4-alpha-glucosidase n=1 Tax=Caulobacter sp. 17J80-11 TaxID=2763502 RepID=UPI0016538DA5|nr:glucan 1,4-alpha-glucosidase [Caulobacter sp. 17J80-11]MBC6983399.1 glucan 1,4-alpha-glucosidase [Caulobacter sp. 17J80-11]